MLTHALAGWQSQYDRMHRSYKRLSRAVPSAGDSSVEYDDDVLHFFMDCWHLKDWLKNDDKVDQTIRDQIRAELDRPGGPLQPASDLANGWKHFRKPGADVTKKNVVWELGSRYVTVSYEVTLADGSIRSLHEVAKASIDAWDEMLRKHKLIE